MRSQLQWNQLREGHNQPMQRTSLHLYGGGGSPSLPGRRHDNDELDHDELDHDELDDEHHHHLDDDVEHDVEHQKHNHEREHANEHHQTNPTPDRRHYHEDSSTDTKL